VLLPGSRFAPPQLTRSWPTLGRRDRAIFLDAIPSDRATFASSASIRHPTHTSRTRATQASWLLHDGFGAARGVVDPIPATDFAFERRSPAHGGRIADASRPFDFCCASSRRRTRLDPRPEFTTTEATPLDGRS